MQIILVRHGATEFNAENRLRGWMDPPLNAEGIAQAQTLRVPPWPVFSSDLLRAQQTAACLGPYTPVAALRPWNVGLLAGLPGGIAHARLVRLRDAGLPAPFGERYEDFLARFFAFLRTLEQPSVLVTHYRNVEALFGEVPTGTALEHDLCP